MSGDETMRPRFALALVITGFVLLQIGLGVFVYCNFLRPVWVTKIYISLIPYGNRVGDPPNENRAKGGPFPSISVVLPENTEPHVGLLNRQITNIGLYYGWTYPSGVEFDYEVLGKTSDFLGATIVKDNGSLIKLRVYGSGAVVDGERIEFDDEIWVDAKAVRNGEFSSIAMRTSRPGVIFPYGLARNENEVFS